MRSTRFCKQAKTPLTFALLGAAAGVSCLLPDTLSPPTTFAAEPPPDEVRLMGTVHDFMESHPDFAVVANGGNGHYAGNVDPQLGSDGRPVFVGLGSAEFAELEASGGIVYTDPFGYETPFPDWRSDLKKNVIATKATIPVDVTIDGITAYVGLDDKELRYGLYSDNGGEPGTLIVETGKIKMTKDTMEWLKGPVVSTVVPAGTYWLAVSFIDDAQHYACSAGIGTSVKQLDYDAVGSGFEDTWSGSDSSATEAVAIYANYTTGNEPMIGDNTVHPTLTKEVDKQQVATRVDMPEDGTLLSITAYVGLNDKLVRYAIYADGGGKPGALLAETFEEETLKDSMQWQTIYLDDTPLTAGTYWLALSFEENNQYMATAAAGGVTHSVAHEAAKDGFLSSWGSSDSTSTERISIFGTYTTETGDTSYLGFKVLSPWRDAQSRPIAPHFAGIGSDDAIEFDIVNQSVIPAENFALEARVLGAAIQTSADGYHRPVTMKLTVGGDDHEPFGPFHDAVLGNVNDDQTITCNSNGTNPRCAVIGTYPAGTDIGVHGLSWLLDNGSGCTSVHWEPKMEASTFDDDVQIKVLRNGDPIPDIEGVYDQASAANYIADFVDEGTGLMSMTENQVIYLFELGTSGGSSSADFQDLVVLITMGDDPAGLCGPIDAGGSTICGDPLGDADGEAKAAGYIDASGGITSAATFAEWYALALGTNVATAHEIVLVNDGTGVYEFLSDEFHPVDDKGLGNEGDDHNYYFTLRIDAKFNYERCADMFIEFEGDDDAWLFVNNELVMDRGGMQPGVSQYVGIDRLGLTDGAETTVRFFHAQRQSESSVFRLRTNIPLIGANQVQVSDMFD